MVFTQYKHSLDLQMIKLLGALLNLIEPGFPGFDSILFMYYFIE